MGGQLILQVVLILVNAFFAMTETACISLNKNKLESAAKDGDKKAELIFDSKSKLNVTLTGCKGITEFKIFDEYGNMKVTYDKSETK